MDINKLVGIFNTLSQVQVAGYQNVLAMAGSLQTLKEIIDELQSQNNAANEPAQ